MRRLNITDSARKSLDGLCKGRRRDPAKHKKVMKSLRLLAADPWYPSLRTKLYEGAQWGKLRVFESYVENDTPSAWRIWWCYADDEDAIDVLMIAPHP